VVLYLSEFTRFFSNAHMISGVPPNTKSNIDSMGYHNFWGRYQRFNYSRIIYGCSMNNLHFPDNNSVEFTSDPIYTLQTHKPVEYNPGYFDPDHDQVVLRIADTIKEAFFLSNWNGPFY
jgi:hypothetical protein